MWITRVPRLRGRDFIEARSSIGLAVTAALWCKYCKSPAGVIKPAVVKELAKRK